MKIIFVQNAEQFVNQIRPKPQKQNKKIVETIISEVRKHGDSALKKYEKKFSKTIITSLKISKKEIKEAYVKTSKDEISAITISKQRLSKTESEVKKRLKKFQIKFDGIRISKNFDPIDSVGCYVPGGLARYPSSAVMSIVPAKVAGVKRIVVVSPPNR